MAASSPQGRFPGAARIDGTQFASADAYGKHLFWRFDGDQTVHIHLGLFGKFRVHRHQPLPEPRPTVRVRLQPQGSDDGAVAVDLTGPTACRLIDPDDEAALVARLGPDPLRSDADAVSAIDRLGRSVRPVGALLLDQSVLAGVGNVYRAELCFLLGIHPTVPGQDLSEDRRRALWDLAVTLLRRGVTDGRIITVDPAEIGVPRRRIRRDEATYVYGRDQCLRCATPVERLDLGSRTCYACPRCQPRPRRRT